MPVTYHDGTTGINQFFTDLASGAVNPAIIVTAGTGSGNDLSDADGAALTANASAISAFVNSGGGLIGHGSGSTAFGWLTTLLAGINFAGGCSSSTLTLTAAGIAAFPGLTNSDIQSRPCHGSFTGNLGGLQILAADSQNRSIIIGGAQVIIQGNISPSPDTDANGVGTARTVTDSEDAVPDADTASEVTDGPNSGDTGQGTTDEETTKERTADEEIGDADVQTTLTDTGGEPSDGSSSGGLPWLIVIPGAIAGAIAVMSAGGIWFARRAGRVR